MNETTELEEARAAVARGFARCTETMRALRSSGRSLDELPQVAAEVMHELDRAQEALASLHEKAHGFADDAYALRHENEALWDLLQTMADLSGPDARAAAAREALRGRQRAEHHPS